MYFYCICTCIWLHLHSGIYAYVILKDGVTDSEEVVIKALRNIVRTQIGGFAIPETFLVSVHVICFWHSVYPSFFACSPGSSRPAKDTLREDNASHSEEDSSQPTWWTRRCVHPRRPLCGGASHPETHQKWELTVANAALAVVIDFSIFLSLHIPWFVWYNCAIYF